MREAILAEGNVLEDILAGADPDDVVGFAVLLFTSQDVLARPQAPIAVTYGGQAGRYELVGAVTAAPA